MIFWGDADVEAALDFGMGKMYMKKILRYRPKRFIFFAEEKRISSCISVYSV